MRFLKFMALVWESFRFASQALRTNILRTTLSLLGVGIGIFAIVGVLTVVDSLEKKIQEDMAFVGTNVMYVQKFPLRFGPRKGGEYPWWKYLARPANTISEYRLLNEKLKNAQAVALIAGRGGNTLKFQSNRFESAALNGATYKYPQIQDLEITQGRYFSTQEAEQGRAVVVIGADIAEELFFKLNPLGKDIKIKGRAFRVVGVMKKEGNNFFGFSARDNQAIIPFQAFAKIYKVGYRAVEPTLAIKGTDNDPGLLKLEGEVRGLLRSKRSLKPREEDNFSLNRTDSFVEAISSLFLVLSFAGSIIGSFSILVGGFGIANIMFVSVKERTSLIGIQKSLGAKNYFILFQFLFEAVFLSLIGGLLGLFLVYLISLLPLGSFDLVLSYSNVMKGILVSSSIGLLSGVIPAYIAARMDPVEAIRA